MIKRVHGRILSLTRTEDSAEARVLLEFQYEGGPRCSVIEGEVAIAPRRGWKRKRIERRLLKRAWNKLEAYFEGQERAEPNIFA